jgi:YqjK-like protein
MSERLIRLAERRAALIAKAENQRGALSQAVVPLRVPLALVDHGLAGINYLKLHPEWLAGSAVLVLLLRPRNIFKWAQRGWLAWRFTRSLKNKLYSS